MNKVIQLGRLTADPETRYTTSNKAVCSFKIAVDRPTRQGEEKQADFFRVTAWGITGEMVQQYFSKGQKILVEGRLENNNYTDKNDVKHFSNDVVAEKVYFCGKRQENTQEKPQNTNNGFVPMNAEEPDELPF